MIEIGQWQNLTIDRIKPHGAYLRGPESDGNFDNDVLLPRKEVLDEWKPGSEIRVFVYRDSDDRLIATTRKPLITMDTLAVLVVKEVTKIGAFLDWGLEKDLLLPFSEQIGKPKKGQSVLVRLYLDKSDRLCASQKLSGHLLKQSPYKVDDWVEGRIIGRHPKIGAFVAVDDKYESLLPLKNIYRALEPASVMRFRVQQVAEDGRMVLSLRDRKDVAMDSDAIHILEKLELNHGFLPFDDETDPTVIQVELGMSKSAYKRAIGRLLKQGRIRFGRGGILLNRKGGQGGVRR